MPQSVSKKKNVPKQSKSGPLIAIGVGVFILLAALTTVIIVVAKPKKKNNKATTPPATTPPATTPPATTPPATTPPGSNKMPKCLNLDTKDIRKCRADLGCTWEYDTGQAEQEGGCIQRTFSTLARPECGDNGRNTCQSDGRGHYCRYGDGKCRVRTLPPGVEYPPIGETS